MNTNRTYNLTDNHIDTPSIQMLDIKDIQTVFKCSKNTAYSLMHSDGFPSIKVGRKLLVSNSSLNKWIRQNEGKSFTLN